MRSEWVNDETLGHIFAALTPANALACRVSLATGLRIGDVLRLRPEFVARGRFTIKEEKTGKPRRVYIPAGLRDEVLMMSGRFWCFEGRNDPKRRRTRQAVYKDLRRAARLFRVTEHVSPHSMRKAFAVSYYHRTGALGKVRDLLNHSSEAVTAIYAMADCLAQNRRNRSKRRS